MALSQRFIEGLWRLDPTAALWAGRFEFAARLPAPDAGWRQRRLRFMQQWQRRFDVMDAAHLAAAERTDLALLRSRVAAEIWQLQVLQEFRWNPADYNVAGALDLILNTDYAPWSKRVDDAVTRLRQVPAYYRAAAAALGTVTREHTELALQQAPGVRAVFDELQLRAQGKHAGLSSALGRAHQALRTYEAQLQNLLKAGNFRSFRLGAELYEAKFGHEIQSAHSAHALYEQALQRREAVLAQMDELARGQWPQWMGAAPQPEDRFARIGAVIDRLSSRHVARDDFVPAIRAQIPELEAWIRQKDLLSLDADKPLVVRETPVYQRGVAGAGIEAPGPYRPQGATYYNVTPLDGLSEAEAQSSLREYNHWILQILNIHEAIPGHYTQLVYANRSPSLVKSLFGNGAMVEGWAVYAERMMMDSGYQASPEMALMYGKWHLRTITNTLLDYRVHVLGLDEAGALDLLQRQAFQTEREAREKWRRVQLTSVQLTSYFSGYSEIWALRERLQARPGFALKAFHEQFLSFGSAPVREIAKLMEG
ncbi:uncharacterized protein (DUF885 family) [Inhella inkyongensis]|uniref:Uncharacterized protein (DUF885 family) n=1 Tax=Inhella inkyongensis TaxID=392593 RepID=A0A840S848_9BURK|nr:DUF885 domain-containing protein [Inhella inkyongensis]MBB5204599.1 uncharacterized protein (DUF885 family) [Inhella inkyongensis]